MAMRRLNKSAGNLEIMGAPLTGTDLRAYVMSGGGVTLKKFKPGLRGKRCFLIFPIHGSERKGLVSVEVKNKKARTSKGDHVALVKEDTGAVLVKTQELCCPNSVLF
ncbi:unnamed protein product [Ilex paraguariensis]|uniref:Uncharacterized protein n=1 Tax=Ilex paraguariensis TaxID=185542 RepID=A0ABC8R9A1_9AQUA